MPRTEIPTSLRDLFATWSTLDQAAQFRAYAFTDMAAVTAAMLAAFEEAKAAPGGDADLFRCNDAQTRRYYEAHRFHHWLRAFANRQSYFVQTGTMAKLRERLERDAVQARGIAA